MATAEEADSAGRWTARTATGPADFTNVYTRYDDAERVYLTRVWRFVGGRYIPREYHRSADEAAARLAHRAAVRRHPKKGTERTLPRDVCDGHCTRCGFRTDADPNHDGDCRP